jgi:hypothetical protein
MNLALMTLTDWAAIIFLMLIIIVLIAILFRKLWNGLVNGEPQRQLLFRAILWS